MAQESNGSALATYDYDETSVQRFSSLMDQELIVQLGDNLMGVHPQAQEIGKLGMRTVAQLAIVTGANPLPGTNGIHAWRDSKGKLCIAFGIGFWRARLEDAGGLLWVTPPRRMSEDEAAEYGVPEGSVGAICSGALVTEVAGVIKQFKALGIDLSLSQAKAEVARTGTGVVGSETWGSGAFKEAKQGRSLLWTALERAERDLYRKLVSVGSSSRPTPGGKDWQLADYVRPMHQADAQLPQPTRTFAQLNSDLGLPTEPVEGTYEELDLDKLQEQYEAERDAELEAEALEAAYEAEVEAVLELEATDPEALEAQWYDEVIEGELPFDSAPEAEELPSSYEELFYDKALAAQSSSEWAQAAWHVIEGARVAFADVDKLQAWYEHVTKNVDEPEAELEALNEHVIEVLDGYCNWVADGMSKPQAAKKARANVEATFADGNKAQA